MGATTSFASVGVGQLRADGVPRGLRASEAATRQPETAPPREQREAPSTPLTRVASDDPLIDPVTEEGQRARGLYFSGPVYKRLGAKGIIRALRGANMNAAVLDMKDGEGRVNYDTKIPALQPQKKRFIADMPAFIAELKAAGIYTIARVVCFSDPFLPRNEPDRAVMDNRPHKAGVVWASWGKRNTWLDPYNPKNHQLIVDITKEVEALGVDEIQLDYVRFPVDEAVRFAMFPAQVETPRREVLLGMLEQIDQAIRIPLGCDVFGLTALRRGDPAGLGQSLEDWVGHVEVFSPMLYINGMQSLIRRGGKARAQNLVFAATNNLRERIGPLPVIRPFLQGFSRGADYYNPEFIAEQVRGVRKANGDGFLFWHPGSSYKMVQQGMVGPATGMNPLPLGARPAQRAEHWGKAQTLREGVAAAPAALPTPAAPTRPPAMQAPQPAAAKRHVPASRAHLQVRVPPGAIPVTPEQAPPAASADVVPADPGAVPSAGLVVPKLQPAPTSSAPSPEPALPNTKNERTVIVPTPPPPGASTDPRMAEPREPAGVPGASSAAIPPQPAAAPEPARAPRAPAKR
jgi:hypothetical protein